MYTLPARPSLAVLPLVLLATLACTGGGTPAEPPAPPEVAPVPASPAPAPTAELVKDGKPTKAAFKQAYADHFQSQGSMSHTYAENRAAFLAQVGAEPRAADGHDLWYAVDAEGTCHKIELSESGLSSEQIFDAAVAQAECGIAPAVE